MRSLRGEIRKKLKKHVISIRENHNRSEHCGGIIAFGSAFEPLIFLFRQMSENLQFNQEWEIPHQVRDDEVKVLFFISNSSFLLHHS